MKVCGEIIRNTCKNCIWKCEVRICTYAYGWLIWRITVIERRENKCIVLQQQYSKVGRVHCFCKTFHKTQWIICKQNYRTLLFSVYFMCNSSLFYNYKISQNETIYNPIQIHAVTVRHKRAVSLRQEFASRRRRWWGGIKGKKEIYFFGIIYRGQLDFVAVEPLRHGEGCLENQLHCFLNQDNLI